MMADRLLLPMVFVNFRLEIALYGYYISLNAVIGYSTVARYYGFIDYCNNIHTSVIYIWPVNLWLEKRFKILDLI